MAISGKPPKPAPPSPAPRVSSEQEVLSLIHKGGSVPQATPADERDAAKPMLVQLRLYADLIGEIDAVRNDTLGRKRRPPSRHAWIVQAIEEKLDRERRNA